MRRSRYEALVRELTPVARKVFDATPIQESWSASEISAELKRQGMPKDRRVIDGCLVALTKDGLVRVIGANGDTAHCDGMTHGAGYTFQRIEPKIPAAQPEAPDMAAHKKPTHVEHLAELAERARAMSVEMKSLADDIGAAAALIDEEIADAGKDTAKLRQLQSLLKELT